MPELENTDLTSVLGWPTPPITGVTWDRIPPAACAVADTGGVCPKFSTQCLGFKCIMPDPFSKALRDAFDASYNLGANNDRVRKGVVRLMSMMTQGVRRWENGVGQTGYELGTTTTKKIWKTYGPWTVDTANCGTNYFVCEYTEGTPGSPGNDPAYSVDNDGNQWSLDGWGDIDLGNSKQSHMAQFVGVGIEYGLDGEGKFRIWTQTPIIGDRWKEPADENDPHDPITLTFTCEDAGGRSIGTEVHDTFPLLCEYATWQPASWPPAAQRHYIASGAAIAPQLANFPRKVFLELDGEWVEDPGLAVYLGNEMSGGVYENGYLDLTGLSLGDATGLEVRFYKVSTGTDAVPVCQKFCAHTVANYRYTLGLKNSPEDTARRWCEEYLNLTAGEKSHFDAVLGVCRNEACQSWAPVESFECKLVESMTADVQSRYAKRTCYWAEGVSNWNLQIIGMPGLGELFEDDLTCDGGQFETHDYVGGTGGAWGTMEEFATESEGISVNQVRIIRGFEVLDHEDHYDEPGPGGDNKTNPTINYGNVAVGDTTVAGVSNDASGAFANSLSNGISGVHRYGGGQVGEMFRRTDYRLTWLHFAQISGTATGWQEFEDGRLKLGFFKADGEEQAEEDENTAAHILIQLHSGIKQVKVAGDQAPPATLGAVITKGSWASGTSGVVGLSLRHRTDSMARPGGTGEDDVVESVVIAGRNVLPKHSERITNWASEQAIQGAGAGGDFLNAGRALQVTAGGGVPAHLVGRILPIVAVCDRDETGYGAGRGHIDEDYNAAANQTKLENAYGLVHALADYQYCDTARALDEAGTVAAVAAAAGTIDRRTWNLVEGAYAMEHVDQEFWATGVNVTRAALTPVLALPHSGRWYFAKPGDPAAVPECIAMYVAVARFKPPLSADNDRDVAAAAINKGWEN